jgi:type IV secretory pathway TraG/TraD family ATPase VirD4
MDRENEITYFAKTNWRNEGRLFGIKRKDRRHHMYIIGKTGTGKSSLLEVLTRQDIHCGQGLALLDPHGDLVERIAGSIPRRRASDVVYFNVSDSARPLTFNPLDRVPLGKRGLAASGLLDAFRKLWPDFWGPRLEHVLRNAILALLEQPEATLSDILRLLDDKVFRKNVTDRVANASVRRFWLHEYEHYPARFRAEAIAPIQNKVGAFLADPVLQRIIARPKSDFDLRSIMDEGKVLLVNLAKGRIGEDAASLLGSMLVTRIGLTGVSRADITEPDRLDFYVYLDEFQTFTTLSVANMLAELRKYRVNLILTNQYLAQVDEAVRDAILGNAGTLITFRVGAEDAEILAREFLPVFDRTDLMALPNYSIYLKLIVDGKMTMPFSGTTLFPTWHQPHEPS